jgi:purine nucleosidase
MVGWELGIGEYAFTEDEIKLLDEVGTPYSQFTLECNLDAMNAFEIQTGQKGMAIHDPTAMAIAIDPSICTEQSSHYVEIETESELTRGMTVVDKLDNADDSRNREVWQRPVEKNIKTKICWSMDSSRWKDLLYQLLQ